MKSHRILIIVSSVALSAGCQGDAENSTSSNVTSSELIAPTGDDVVASELVTDADLTDAVNFERAPVSVSWPLASGADLALRPKAHRAHSRHYRVTVSAAELRAGVALPTIAPRPVIKLSRAGEQAVSSDQLILIDHTGRSHVAGAGLEAAARAQDLNGGPVQFAAGTTLFRVMPELGAGHLTLAVTGSAALDPTETVVIQVLEADSDTALTVQTSSDTYLAGDRMSVDVSWSNPTGLSPTTGDITGALLHPNGERIPLTLSPAATGGFTADLTGLVAGDALPGHLWELEIDATGEVGGAEVRRTVKTAFAVATPTARLDRAVSVTGGDAMRIDFTVDVGSPGRYAVTGVLHGTDARGALAPCVFAQSAAFVEPGSHQLSLGFDLSAAGDACAAPYELRDLRLNDQTRLGLLHRQAQALVIR